MTPAEDVGLLIRGIIKPTLDAGGSFSDVLALLESVVTGVLLFGVKIGGDEVVLDVMVEHVKKRLADLRLKDTDPEGTA